MGYLNITREINIPDLQKFALIRIRQNHLIDTTKYKILSTGIFEHVKMEDDTYADIFQVVVCDMCCNESKIKFNMKDDLDLTPEGIYNYYLYRIDIKDVKRGSAIRVIKPATDTDPDWFAYNAIIIDRNVRQISYVMVPGRGPFHRILTARQMYTHGIKIYLYEEPDDNINLDNMDLGWQCDQIR